MRTHPLVRRRYERPMNAATVGPGFPLAQGEVPGHRSERTIAIIGSFRQHYSAVKEAIAEFRSAGWSVLSPAGTKILEDGIDFVRFESDNPSMDDAAVQTATLINIFAAEIVYVIAPAGYVGRTTCYELGRLIQANHSVYFSDVPVDLPVHVPAELIADPEALVALLVDPAVTVRNWQDACDDVSVRCERELTDGARR